MSEFVILSSKGISMSSWKKGNPPVIERVIALRVKVNEGVVVSATPIQLGLIRVIVQQRLWY